MLVLTRKHGEQIRIGDITVKIVRIASNSVRIGTDAGLLKLTTDAA